MTCELRIERSDAFSLKIEFRGPVELGAALAAVVARFEAGEPVARLEGSSPVGQADPPPLAKPRARTATERSQKHRADQRAKREAALHATGNATDATHATLHATGSVAVASASLSAESSSLSPAFSASLGESTRGGSNGRNGATATDATALPVASVDLDAPMPGWATDRVATLAQTLGPWPATFDAREVWAGYLGNLARVPGARQPTPAGWQKWLTDQRRYERTRPTSGRVVQRDPPGPKAYRQASHDDPWDDEEKSA